MWAIFLGCLLVAFGPSAALIYYCVSQRPQLTIVCLSAAFFWMCSVFATSLFWLIAKVLGIQGPVFLTVCFGVLVQEASRFFFLWCYDKVEVGMAADALRKSVLGRRRGRRSLCKLTIPFSDFSSSVAAGTGFGTMFALVWYGSALASATGPAAFYMAQCPGVPLLLLSALNCFCFLFLHVALQVIAAAAWRINSGRDYRIDFAFSQETEELRPLDTAVAAAAAAAAAGAEKQNCLGGNSNDAGGGGGGGGGGVLDALASAPGLAVAAVSLHLLASSLSLLNSFQGGCYASLPLVAVVTLVSCGVAAFVVTKRAPFLVKARVARAFAEESRSSSSSSSADANSATATSGGGGGGSGSGYGATEEKE